MKQFLLILNLTLTFFVTAQDSTSVKPKRLFVGVNFSPDCNYRTQWLNNFGFYNTQWIDIQNYFDPLFIPKLGFTTGINFCYQVNNCVGLEVGFQYSNKSYKTIPILTSYNVNEPSAIATNIINYHYLEIPLKTSFAFSKHKLQFITGVGTVFNYLLFVVIKTIPETPTANFQKQKNISNYPFTKFTISPTISAGLKYKITEKINVRAEPTLRFGLVNIDKNSYTSTHLWNVGLNVSLNVKL